MSVVLHPLRQLTGHLRPPGDKSISHRALLLAAVAEGGSLLEGLGTGVDVRTTRRVLETLGIKFVEDGPAVRILGAGWEGFPGVRRWGQFALDCENSGTTTRLLLGLLAGRPGDFSLCGDESLSRRPMGRVVEPLSRMGARIEGGDQLPLVVRGGSLRGCSLTTQVASAQVKSALILAALQAEGESVITEPRSSRDHTERLLRVMGSPLWRDSEKDSWHVEGGCQPLKPLHLAIPGDPSSAAPFVALACALPGSDLVVEGVDLNPRRTGFFSLLQRMGGRVTEKVEYLEPEPTGVLQVQGGALRGIEVQAGEVVDAIDELPLLGVLGAVAEGTTVLNGARELRLKESDRIAEIIKLLHSFGVEAEEFPDGFAVRGPQTMKGTAFETRGDHRIAMAGAVASALAEGDSVVSGEEWVAVSNPAFFHDLNRLGERR